MASSGTRSSSEQLPVAWLASHKTLLKDKSRNGGAYRFEAILPHSLGQSPAKRHNDHFVGGREEEAAPADAAAGVADAVDAAVDAADVADAVGAADVVDAAVAASAS